MRRMAVVVDYQNVHLTAAGVFAPYRPAEESLISPWNFARRLAKVKNESQPNLDPVEVARVEVYRGLPLEADPNGGYARNLSQKHAWEREAPGIVFVTLRPLKYLYELHDGKKVPIWGSAQEKGVDVLCALALCRLARSGHYDVVVLASRDSDLAPALDEAMTYRRARVEAAKWYLEGSKSTYGSIKTEKRIWTTSMIEKDFQASLDTANY